MQTVDQHAPRLDAAHHALAHEIVTLQAEAEVAPDDAGMTDLLEAMAELAGRRAITLEGALPQLELVARHLETASPLGEVLALALGNAMATVRSYCGPRM